MKEIIKKLLCALGIHNTKDGKSGICKRCGKYKYYEELPDEAGKGWG